MIKLTYGVLQALNNAKYAKRIRRVLDPLMAKNPTEAYLYAHYVLKGPFPEGERAIAKNVTFAELYAADCLHLEGHKAGDWSWDYLETHKTSAVQDLSRMYLSFELDPASKALILDTIGGKFKRKVCNHITVAYNITEELYQELMSSLKDATLEVIGYQSGDGVDCVAVEVNGSLDRKDGEIYHVTVSLAPGHKAEESKALLKQQGIQHVIPFDIHGELKLMKK